MHSLRPIRHWDTLQLSDRSGCGEDAGRASCSSDYPALRSALSTLSDGSRSRRTTIPHTTSQYGFAFLLEHWADDLSRRITGGLHRFLLLFEQGAPQVLMLDDYITKQIGDGYVAELNRRKNTSWLFFDPFDYPEYCFMSWSNLEQKTVEGLLGEQLRDKAFESKRSGNVIKWPSSWQVMF